MFCVCSVASCCVFWWLSYAALHFCGCVVGVLVRCCVLCAVHNCCVLLCVCVFLCVAGSALSLVDLCCAWLRHRVSVCALVQCCGCVWCAVVCCCVCVG